jgi:hypothetical protein
MPATGDHQCWFSDWAGLLKAPFAVLDVARV